MKKYRIKDKPNYEIYSSYKNYADIDIPDEEINEVLKRLLEKTISNPRLFEKVRSDLLDIYEKELQAYAEEQFFEKGRGNVYKDSKTKDAKGVTTYSFKGSYWEPPEWEGYVISDFSGKEIEDEDDTWATPNGEVGTYKEVLEDFMNNEVEILTKGSEEWEKAKQYFIEEHHYTDEDIEKAQFVKMVNSYDYDFAEYEDMTTWDLKQLMDDYEYQHIYWDSALIDFDNDDYDPY